jgi:tetratricopeptide (TPR) repeat protein
MAVAATARIQIIVAIGSILFAAGCPSRPAITTTPTNNADKATSADNLTLALDSLRKLAETGDADPAHRTVFYLNQWLATNQASEGVWQPDRMLEHLPRALRNTPGMERLNKLQFRTDTSDLPHIRWLDDISYLQQTLWLHDIATLVRRQPPAKELKSWLKTIEESVGLPEAEQLALAERLFDWTIRNIQLDPLPPPPKGPVATAGSGAEQIAPAAQGEVGPGYGRLPLLTLLYGHGDAHDRARVFILLCRQAGIDAVMLGLQEESSPTPRGWAPAVLVAGKLYLFDTALGLPIPGPNWQGIATLDQVTKAPELLKELNIEGAGYPVGADELKAVVAMIDAEPAALSRRMQLLETAMPTTSRLVLAAQPSQLEPKLQQTKSLLRVILWRVPFDAVLYQVGHQEAARRDPQVAQEFQRQSNIFAPGGPLAQGRNLHLQGRLEPQKQTGQKAGEEDTRPVARTFYLRCRPPDREIDALVTNEFYRRSVGLEENLPEDPAQRKAIIEHYTGVAREGKFNATYWLGLTYYEVGKYDTAIEWLGQRTVQVSPPSPWTAGARYNLACCYEQLGNYSLARQWLESDKDSPQRAGNLLRAKWLEKMHGKPSE